MKIGVIGGGVVGQATAAAFRGHCDEVRVWDIITERCTDLLEDVLRCDVVFVCCPEGAVDSFFSAVKATDFALRNYVLRSTVPVGTTRRLAERYGLPNLVHSPEFLTERTATEDAANPRLTIIGGPSNSRCAGLLSQLYGDRWPNVITMWVDSDVSELVKLATNAFFATKVSFWNEVESYCRAAGIDYETVRAACVAEGRVGDLHTHVPGPDGKRGFGGKCLPKDLDQLISCGANVDLMLPLMREVRERNDYHRGRM